LSAATASGSQSHARNLSEITELGVKVAKASDEVLGTLIDTFA